MVTEVSNTDAQKLVTKRELAPVLRLSVRSIEHLVKRKAIPVVRISARCVRFSVPAVLNALARFEQKEVGR